MESTFLDFNDFDPEPNDREFDKLDQQKEKQPVDSEVNPPIYHPKSPLPDLRSERLNNLLGGVKIDLP